MKKFLLTISVILIGITAFASDCSSYKLDNGQTVVIKEVKDNPIVIIDTWIKTGSINETDENNGVAHFLEHLFFKGTAKHPAKEFDTILESKGAVTNAATSKDFTHYYILIPSNHFELALDLHSDMLLNPLIPRKELEKERKVVIEEIAKNNDKPTNILYNNMVNGFYSIHPYKRQVIGTKEIIETISREQILDFYNKWYTPENMTTVIIGDVDTQKALNLVKNKFNKQSTISKKKKKESYKMDKKPSKQTEKTADLKVETGYLLIGFKGVNSIEHNDSYALDVLSTILGDGKSSRLYKNLKEKQQIVHSIYASHSSMKEDSLFYISANYANDNVEQIKTEIFNQIKKLQEEEISEDEIQKAKNIIERDTFYARESVSNIASEIGYTVTLTGNTSYYKNYLENINKVTSEDLKRVAKEYLNIDSAVISIINPQNKPVSNITKSEPKQEVQAKIVSQLDNTTKYELSNGATLIITKNTNNDIVAMEMTSKGGNNLEKIPGIASLTADMLQKGTQKYTKEKLAQLLEENGIRLSTSSKGDSFSIATKFTKNQRKIALDIFSEVSKNASFEFQEFDLAKKDKLISIKNIKNNPDSFIFDEFKTALWEGTPYGVTGKILNETIPMITVNDLISYYKDLFTAQNVIITVNGNVDENVYINYFSNLLKNNGKEKIDIKNFANKYIDLTQNKIVKVEKDSQAAWLLYGWHTDGVENQKDWATLQVIDAILGSGMSSRLFTTLRDEQSLAYQVGTSFATNINKGVFALYIATNPDSVKQASDGLLNEINRLKNEFVTDKELSEAKDKILGNFVLSMETNMDKASLFNSLETTGRGYDFIKKYPDIINAVTVQDIIKVSNKYFSKPYVFAILGSKETIDKI